ncbi:PTS cellobiose transporter subunit IIA [Enterococcus saccharolyticus]|uniref:PTS cellobiose transporter subunit IIA n=1 Tax=Candidatus Enterococcus willemsii TaxID=1857215 RepID=A0ABQ6YZH4_9ENTE|nr:MULTISPECIES: PTS cellobiose transporter subunit IIA [Enterococcus]KAF1303772.1 PTS cellobiose transporter subunit IIA [Enterococcus sp. CU12B]MCD5003297.1 PTS cellobiose transporter subunit IIA [Enterococcus saccharolyticus]
MDQETLQGVAFEIILSSGDARTLIHESFAHMRANEFEKAAQKLEDANESLVNAHKAQTELLKEYANGETIVMEVIMVHAQDHLMTTMTLREVALEMLELYKRG